MVFNILSLIVISFNQINDLMPTILLFFVFSVIESSSLFDLF